MQIFATMLKYFSVLFHCLLGLFLTGMALVFLISGSQNISLKMLPMWKGPSLPYWVLGLGLLGLISALLALIGKARALLVLWSLIALGLFVYGFFIGPYIFSGAAEAKGIAWLTFGALGAFFGSLMQYYRDPRRARI